MRPAHVAGTLLLTLALTLATLAATPGARADDTDPRRTAARDLANNGDAMFARGRCDKAIAMWSDANDVFHAPTLLLRIARCQALIGKVVQATETLQQILGAPADPNASAAFADARVRAAQEIDGVRARVASLEIDVVRPAGAPDAIVEVDDASFAEGRAVPVDPGPHHVQVRVRDATWERSIVLEDAATVRIPVTAFAETPAPRHSLQRPVGYALGIGGLVALGIGGAFGYSVMTNSSSLANVCGPQRTSCPQGSQPQIDSVKSQALVADVSLGTGAALFIAGAITLLTVPAPETVVPRFQLTADGLGARLAGSF